MERWRGRVALVTGASVGIGASIYTELAKHGIKVVGCARDVHKIEKLAEGLPTGSFTAIKCDLQNESEILNVFKEIREKHGRLDICINNAGFSTICSLINGTTEDFKAILDVNVVALCICTREAIKLMRESNVDDGQIIHISSIAAHTIPNVVKGLNFYVGTKTMVSVLAEGLRRELRNENSNIRVASVSPGLTETEFLSRMMKDPKRAQELYSSIKAFSSDDISACVVSILQAPKHVDINDIILRPTAATE